jgi:hypothetical protein
MKRLRILVVLLTLAAVTLLAHAEAQEIRACDFKLKGGCVAGDAKVTLTDGVVTRVEVDVVWCNRQRGAPGYTCMIDSSRGDGASTWSEEGGVTVIAGSEFSDLGDSTRPDRVKVTDGQEMMIDLNETQTIPRCGAGAELPQSIVIPARGKLCRVRFSEP